MQICPMQISVFYRSDKKMYKRTDTCQWFSSMSIGETCEKDSCYLIRNLEIFYMMWQNTFKYPSVPIKINNNNMWYKQLINCYIKFSTMRNNSLDNENCFRGIKYISKSFHRNWNSFQLQNEHKRSFNYHLLFYFIQQLTEAFQ